ncbi:MAG: hypothetical protein IJW05_06860 [Lentisphaeria bacterium]|nr:hypothetical protein [Lentisphaeria bacterium]
MKKLMLLALLTMFGRSFAGDVADISTFKDVSGLSNSAPVFVENFEDGAKRWYLPDGFSVKLHEGYTGSGALVYDRKTASHYKFASVRLGKLDPRQRYKVTITYRTELQEDPARKVVEVFDVRFFKGKKMINRVFRPVSVMNQPEWSEISTTFSVPADADFCLLSLMISPKRVGKQWYDNIRVEPAGNAGEQFHLIKPAMLKLDAAKIVEFKFKFFRPLTDRDLALVIDANGKKYQVPVKGNIARCALKGMNDPVVKMTAYLVDLKNKEILNRNSFVVYNHTAKTIKGSVSYESNGHIRVDGKPFLPIGIFLGTTTPKDAANDFQRIKDAGFNTVLALGTHPISFFAGKKSTHRESMVAGMDFMHKYGLKYIFGIKYQIPSQRPYKTMDNVKGVENVTRYIISSVKDHPALLGWYVSDENPADQLPQVQQLRRTIGELDPWHPVLTLTDKPKDMFTFAATGDVLMVDPYPIGWRVTEIDKPQNMQSVRTYLDAAAQGGTPVWLVPQIFSWSSFQTTRKHRYPTATEIRSMALQGTVRGVQGYVFYAHHAIFIYSEKADPGKSAMQWENVVPTAKLLNELTPFILSKEQAPQVKIRQISGKPVEAKAMRCNGKTVVVITAVGPGKAEAEITVTGENKLSSRFGNTVNSGNGKYLFTGTDVDSDVLF